eukprot:8724948-Pyramimonas_sp.AAC.1
MPGVLDLFGSGFGSVSKKELSLRRRPRPPGSRNGPEMVVPEVVPAPDGSKMASKMAKMAYDGLH